MQISLPTAHLRDLWDDPEISGQLPDNFTGLATLREATPGDLSFLTQRKYLDELSATKASAVLVPADVEADAPSHLALIRVQSPSFALMLAAEVAERQLRPQPAPGIHPTAVIDPTAEVDPAASVGPYCVVEANATVAAGTVLHAQVFVGHHATIGPDCVLMPHTSVHRYCALGARVTLLSGAVIGGDGFGFESSAAGHRKIPQIGRVELADDVEVGTNSSIDRARLGLTRIGQGTKIDSLVQIGHNCIIGRHCIICAQTGLAGSTTLEDFVVMAGQTASAGHLTIGAGTQIGGQAGVNADVVAGSKLTGTPAQNLMAERKMQVLMRRLPELFQRVKALESPPS